MKLSSGIIIVVGVLFVLVLFIMLMRQRQKKEYILGEPMAKAIEAEQQRKAMGDTVKSPMPDMKYDFWRGEQNLIKPVQASLDSILSDLCQDFAKNDAATRAKIRASMSMDEFYTILTFSRRAAVFAIRKQESDFIANGLTAIAMIEKERVDFRDILIALSLLYHSAKRIGKNADQLFQDAATLSETNVSELIIGFIKQSPEKNDLRSAWGYEEVETEEGIGFIEWMGTEYNPTYDLKKIALEISDFIATDKYQPSSVTIATELPEVWLKSIDDAALDKALKTVRGVASISADLRPDAHPEHASQMFTVFLVEVADESVAQTLMDISKKKKPSDYCMLGLTKGRLFCLVIARAFVAGEESFETPESLTRFSKGTVEILIRHVDKV
jgi:hypothetical protein